jgi:hypothetical protein
MIPTDQIIKLVSMSANAQGGANFGLLLGVFFYCSNIGRRKTTSTPRLPEASALITNGGDFAVVTPIC